MPRTARKESETGYYHIIIRGNNRNWIFSKDRYKLEFLSLLKNQEEDGLIEVTAWCIMDNHVHIVLKAGMKELSLAIKKINIKFAMSYNQKEKTIGHVFQDRFKSEAIETDAYLLQVVRYVHNNPVKAKIANALLQESVIMNNLTWKYVKPLKDGTVDMDYQKTIKISAGFN